MAPWHHDAETLAKAIHSTGGTLTTIFLFTRLWARTQRFRGLWWDDYILVASGAMLLVCNGSGGAAPGLGFTMTPESTSFGTTLHAASSSFAFLAIAWSKTAFAVTLLRLTPGSALDLTVLWLFVVLLNGFVVALVVVTWVGLCEAVLDYPTLPVGCIPTNTHVVIMTANYILSAVADVTFALYPWRIVKRLAMSSQERKAVVMTMGLVGLSGIVGIARTAWTLNHIRDGVFEGDTTWYSILGLGLVQLEAVVMIIAQTIPIIRIVLVGSRPPSRATLAHHETSNKKTFRAGSPNQDAVGHQGVSFVETGASIELVELPTGRIVTAQEARRIGRDAKPQRDMKVMCRGFRVKIRRRSRRAKRANRGMKYTMFGLTWDCQIKHGLYHRADTIGISW